jgi:hypothetical protein
MITTQNLPADYQPFDEVIWCSNRVRGGAPLALVGEAVPVLIGKGQPLRVWLQVRKESQEAPFEPVVEASVPRYPSIRVEGSNRGVIVSMGAKVLLQVREDGGKAIVENIDLRPLGLLLYGDLSHLMVGSNRFAKASISGGKAFIAMG